MFSRIFIMFFVNDRSPKTILVCQRTRLINYLLIRRNVYAVYCTLENRNGRKRNETEEGNFEKSNKGETEYYIGNI